MNKRIWSLICTAALLAAVLSILFWKGFVPGRTVFSNDGPLGIMAAEASKLPGAMLSYWQDLNFLGYTTQNPGLNLTNLLNITLGPVGYTKFYAPFSLWVLGLGAWFCFYQWGFKRTACVIGALAAALNADFFSTACWGVAAQPIAFGMNFVALGLLADGEARNKWVKTMLAGAAIGVGVMEAFDIGAIFSLFTAAFIAFQSWNTCETLPKRLVAAGLRVAVVALLAAFVSAAALITLVGTQIRGVAGVDSAISEQNRQERWDWATQWSLPKREVADILVPGIYGFRMDTPEGGAYWGAGGRHPAWDRYFASGKQGQPPAEPIRFSGGGHYAGILVLLAAAWSIAQSFRKAGANFSERQKRFVWFWGVVLVVSLLLAFGRFAPFYQFFYALPYASTIRNPAKFIHIFEWSLVILAAYGLDSIWRGYLERPTTKGSYLEALRVWWAQRAAFDVKWFRGTLVFLGVIVLAWLAYISAADRLASYIQEVKFDPADAAEMARFSIRQPGWTVLFLVICLALLAGIFSGWLAGRRARLAGVLLGLVLTLDLARANAPWVVTYDWRQKYASDAVVDFLRQDAHQHRVTVFPLAAIVDFRALPPEARPLIDMYSQLRTYYQIEWMQHHFQYYNVQSLDVVQMPRMPADYEAFLRALGQNPLRYWELTNVRYLLGPAPILELLNQRMDPVQKRFRVALQFNLVPKPGVAQVIKFEDLTAVADTNGVHAIFEFTGALQRTGLYDQWQVPPSDEAALKILASPEFNPASTVLVAGEIQARSDTTTNQQPARVEISSYAPKHIVFKTRAQTPTVLLQNDKYDPNWKAMVDGKPAELLRCNFIMRGVQVPPGEHVVEMRFQPPLTGFYLSLAAIAVAISLAAYLAVGGSRPKASPPQAAEV